MGPWFKLYLARVAGAIFTGLLVLAFVLGVGTAALIFFLL